MSFSSNTSFLVVLFVISCSTAFSSFCSIKFKDCGSPNGKLIGLQINETCSDGTAILKKNSNVRINFTFSAVSDEPVLKSKVYGEIGVPIDIPFPLDNPDACKDSGLQCPIKKNTQYNYLPYLSVLKSFPSVTATVKWELQDGNGKNIFCVVMRATIQ